jgi:hypothetical protein
MYSVPGNPNPDTVTQESLLLGAAERVGRIRQGRIAVHIHLSRLRAQNRQEGHIRIALRMLEPMVNAYRGQMFLLTTSDIVFMVKDANLTDVENMIYKLRALFSKDPLTFADSGDGIDNFCTWYDLTGPDYDAFLSMARQATEDARARNREKAQQATAASTLDAKLLADLLERLARTDISRLIRRQAAIRVGEGNFNAEVIFQEFFVSVTELQKELNSEVSLLSNRWLFQHLSLSLDRRVLSALGGAELRAWPVVYGLNLNLATLKTETFAEFAQQIAGHAGLSVELQILDIMADSRAYFEAHNRLLKAGHQICIDGINELAVQFMDLAQFKADLYKLHWSPEMGDSEHGDQVVSGLMPVGLDKVVLGRCDSEAAIQWGLSKGIRCFEGRYVDTMIAAYTMAVCDKSAACTLAQCSHRHVVLSGPPRPDCGNLDMLDTPPVMRAIRTRVPAGEP